jgi:protein-disulfide isomerase
MTPRSIRSGLAIALGMAAIGACSATPHRRDTIAPNASASAKQESIPEVRAVGRSDAPLTIEVFSDFQCAGCADFHLQTLARVREEYCATGKVYLIHHEYPLPIPSHQYSREAARWAVAASVVGQYEPVADALFREQANWGKSGNIESVVSHVLTGDDFARVKQARQERATEIDDLLAKDLALGRSFPVHGTPSFRILVGGTEVFADHDEPDKLTPTTPRLKLYPNLKRYLDEHLAK